MSFVPLIGPAVLAEGRRPREGIITFTDEPEGDRRVALPIVSAVPVLTRALGQEALHPTVGLLAASAHFALRLVTSGKYEATTFRGEHGWMPVILGDDRERLRLLAEFRSYDGIDAEEAEAQVWAMVAAAVDSMATPGAARLTARRSARSEAPPPGIPIRRSGRLQQARERQQRITLSLRIEADEESLTEGVLRMVLQVHDEADPLHFADASVLWRDDPSLHGFGPRVRSDIALRLGEAAAAWPVLDRMRFAALPTELILETDDLVSLLADGVGELRRIGVDVLWPRALGRELRAHAVLDIGPSDPTGPAPRHADDGAWEAPLRTGLLATEEIAAFRWHIALGDDPLSEEEMQELAEAASPILRLRGAWTVVDPSIARRARDRIVRRVTGVEALGAALTGDGAAALLAPAPGAEVGLPEVIVGASLERLRDQVAGAGLGELLPEPDALAATLRDYQRRGMTWLAELTGLGLGGCLADDMGLGKTITLIALHLHRHADAGGTTAERGPTLVVCPATVLGNWEAEIRRFAPGVPVHRFHGPGRALPESALGDPGFVLTTYGTARRDARLLAAQEWDLVVADEAQHLKNPASATARGMRLIPSTARVALTGTPVENNLADLWAILDWCVPGLLGTRKAFRKAWASPIESGVEAATRQFASMIAPFLLRRRKTDPGIAPELPPKTETDHLLTLSREQTVLYEAFVRDTMTRIERLPGDDPARRGLVLAMLTGLKQICNHPAQFLRHDQGKIAGRSEKVELLDDIIDTTVSEGGAVLVFTQYVALARLLSRYWSETGVDHLFLHGGTTVREREAMVRRFQSPAPGEDSPAVFLLSLKAGGTGLNLTRADHVVHVDRWWNPAVEDQASDRAWRLGQTRPVQIHRLMMRGTLEERIALLLEHKRSLAEAVLGAGETALTELSNAELRELVTLDRSWR